MSVLGDAEGLARIGLPLSVICSLHFLDVPVIIIFYIRCVDSIDRTCTMGAACGARSPSVMNNPYSFPDPTLKKGGDSLQSCYVLLLLHMLELNTGKGRQNKAVVVKTAVFTIVFYSSV